MKKAAEKANDENRIIHTDYWRDLDLETKSTDEFYNRARKPEIGSHNEGHSEPTDHPSGISD